MEGLRILSRTGSPSDPIRVAVFFSGSGTGLNALLSHQTSLPCNHKTVVCVTNKEKAGGIVYAENHRVPVIQEFLNADVEPEKRRLDHESRIVERLEKYDVELIVLSGYMRLLSKDFVDRFYPRIVNIHPSLLPAFPGADAHADVLKSGVKVSGCTVHLVDDGMDTGTILAQRRVPVFETDERSQLAQRIQVEEHRLYPSVIDLICSGHRFDLDD